MENYIWCGKVYSKPEANNAKDCTYTVMSNSGSLHTGSATASSDMLPSSVVQDDQEHTLHYSQALPYASQLDREAELWLSDICTQLVVSVQAHDFAPGCLFWVKSLSWYAPLIIYISSQTYVSDKSCFHLVILT